ncbi:MAG: aminotransferase class I/II-fold pyridoxal phosphate-dependent enzyme [Clostridia bacterium]|nr:aminotransferase class I/II-fold pyridoxal phosphate-dependent enzyme [Clostridia bacterium]
MIRFDSDYTQGAHPRILDALVRTNMEQTCAYAEDGYSEEARALIRNACEAPDADVHFLVGGTGTNTTVIAAALRPWEGVICPETGHINVHESGAIESSGHKVVALPQRDGKLPAETAEQFCAAYHADGTKEHMVKPGMIYISQPTEVGTLYSAAELTALKAVCERYGMFLFVDGARLGYGLAADGSDVTLPLLAKTADAFTVGGTKVGALFGEAVVISNAAMKPGFRYMIKQRGNMLAKGRLLGVQFREMFLDGLYFEMGAHAIEAARRLKKIFADAGYPFAADSPTNQQFPILPDAVLEKLSTDFAYSYWNRYDENSSVVRFCTSWATTDEELDALEAALPTLAG